MCRDFIADATSLSNYHLDYNHPRLEACAYGIARRYLAGISSILDASNMFDMNRHAITLIEKGNKDPSYYYRQCLAKHLGLNMGGLSALIWAIVTKLKSIAANRREEVINELYSYASAKGDTAGKLVDEVNVVYLKIKQTMSHDYKSDERVVEEWTSE